MANFKARKRWWIITSFGWLALLGAVLFSDAAKHWVFTLFFTNCLRLNSIVTTTLNFGYSLIDFNYALYWWRITDFIKLGWSILATFSEDGQTKLACDLTDHLSFLAPLINKWCKKTLIASYFGVAIFAAAAAICICPEIKLCSNVKIPYKMFYDALIGLSLSIY